MSAQTVTLQISGLRLETFEAISAKAREAGKTVEEYLRSMIESDVRGEKPLSEILEPIRQSFDQSGMSEEELDDLFEQAREAVYQESLRK